MVENTMHQQPTPTPTPSMPSIESFPSSTDFRYRGNKGGQGEAEFYTVVADPIIEGFEKG